MIPVSFEGIFGQTDGNNEIGRVSDIFWEANLHPSSLYGQQNNMSKTWVNPSFHLSD